MMAGRGTGTPNWFMCYACRRAGVHRGTSQRVKLTGRTRPNPSNNRTQRVSDTEREYECLTCGHIGWSRHKDLERLS